MAGVDKICEFSSDYEGYEMYKSKRNHIQVLSKYRKKFRGHKATLYVFENGYSEVFTSGGYSTANMAHINPNPTEDDWNSGNAFRISILNKMNRYDRYSTFFENISEYKQALKKYNQRLLMNYDYILHVPTVPGQVNGLYTNSTHDLTAVKRRLKRMLGCRNLTIKVVRNESMYNFLDVLHYTLKDNNGND